MAHLETKFNPDLCSTFITKGNIGYMNLGKIKKEQVKDVFSRLGMSSGLIIDCRTYPFSFPMEEICYQIIPEQRNFVQVRIPILAYPCAFIVEKYGWMLGSSKDGLVRVSSYKAFVDGNNNITER